MTNNEYCIWEDTRQQTGKHELKHKYWDKHGIQWDRSKLPIGDYCGDKYGFKVIIDTKKDIQEIIQNVTKDHERFKKECMKAQERKIKLIVLIENKDGVKSKNDLGGWYNWRLKKNPKATTGKQLMKILYTMEERYCVEFRFCAPEEAGQAIVDILYKEE